MPSLGGEVLEGGLGTSTEVKNVVKDWVKKVSHRVVTSANSTSTQLLEKT
jgi:hypothetical protein